MIENRKYLFMQSSSICYLLFAVNCFLLFKASPPLQAMLVVIGKFKKTNKN